MESIFIWMIGINALSFFLFGLDKYRAKKKRWRIPEITLFALSLLGGSLGSFLGMQFFRHKTKKLKFQIGIPLCFLLNVLIICFLHWKLT